MLYHAATAYILGVAITCAIGEVRNRNLDIEHTWRAAGARIVLSLGWPLIVAADVMSW